MNILSLATRNVVRNWHRTIVTTLAMAFAGFIMILFASLMQGLLQVSERNAVIMELGDIQIHAKGYRDDPDLYKRIDNPDLLVEKIRKQGFYATKRVFGFGLAASNSTSSGVQLRGTDLLSEKTVTAVHKHVNEGAWLSLDDSHGVVLGKKLARTLGVTLNQELIVISQATDGSMANDLFHVRGILKSIGEEIDRSGFYMLESTFRELMVLPQGAHEIAIMRPDRNTDLSLATKKVSAIAPQYETLNWKELKPVIARIIDAASTQIIVMLLITYIAVGMVVLNAMLMSVFERIQEFGVMKAIGVTPWQIVAIIFAESLVQILIASILALLCGWWAGKYFEVNGIDLSAIASGSSFGGVALEPIWYAHVTPDSITLPIIFLVAISLLAVIYPATKAAVIQPIKAIYHR